MITAWKRGTYRRAAVLLMLGATTAMLPRASHGEPADKLIGATVISEDEQLAGVVDQISQPDPNGPVTLVIGLAGYLGQGEKDVAVPGQGLTISLARTPPVGFANGRYGGASLLRVHLPLTVQQLVSQPAYRGPNGVGVPSQTSTSPAVTPKKPSSSTESGGPG
jgi:PRC-barrel domain